MTKQQRRIVVCVAIALTAVIVWLAYRVLHHKLYRVTFLPSLGGNNTAPYAMNDRNEIVGLAQDPNGDYHLVLWDRERKLHDLGKAEGQFDINNRGQIAGFMDDPNGNPRAFLREPNGRMHWIDMPAGTILQRSMLNNKGQLIGKFNGPYGSDHLCRWDPNEGVRDLGPVVVKELGIRAFNDKGQVLGHDFTPTSHCPMFLWDPNNGFLGVYLDIGDLNNHSCLIGWRDIPRDGRYMMKWQKGRLFTKLFKGESGQFSKVIVNDANQILCGLVVHSRWERFSNNLFRPWDTRVLWAPNKGHVFLEKQLPLNAKGIFWPMDLNNHGCIVAGLLSDDKKRSKAIVMEPIPKRWGR